MRTMSEFSIPFHNLPQKTPFEEKITVLRIVLSCIAKLERVLVDF